MASTSPLRCCTRHHVRGKGPDRWLRHPAKSQPHQAPRALWQRWAEPADAGGSARRGASAAGGACGRYHRGQWRCADCRHHQLHQYQQPERDAGRRFAGQEGGGSRPQGQTHIKTSLAPGSRVVTEYLRKPACCLIWKSWVLRWRATAAPPALAMRATSRAELNDAITSNDLVCAAVLSGNRNFEARIHPNPQKPTFWPARRWWWPTPSRHGA